MSLQNEQNEESIPINKNIRHDHTSVNNQGSKQNISNMGVLSYWLKKMYISIKIIAVAC